MNTPNRKSVEITCMIKLNETTMEYEISEMKHFTSACFKVRWLSIGIDVGLRDDGWTTLHRDDGSNFHDGHH